MDKNESRVRAIYDEMKRHKKAYDIEICGLELTVFPDVFSPLYFPDSEWFASNISAIVGNSSLLDIGTGTGIVALRAGLDGAKVTATDINPEAVLNARYNFEKYDLDQRVLQGDLFEPILGEAFDYIFWNHPFGQTDNPNEDMLLRSGFDYQYEALKRYILEGKGYARKALLLGTVNTASLEFIPEFKILRESADIIHRDHHMSYRFRILKL